MAKRAEVQPARNTARAGHGSLIALARSWPSSLVTGLGLTAPAVYP
jgi:hypothetical protein